MAATGSSSSSMKLIRPRSFLVLLSALSLFAGGSFAQTVFHPVPTRILGQNSAQITSYNPNLVEGREFDFPDGIAIDTSTSPPALYVADYLNNRVLGFRSATSFANGQHADIVIGQTDFVSTLQQGPGHTNNTGLYAPTGLAVDASGNLYVADCGNNRILRFPKPFAQTGNPAPDMVIGQADFTTNKVNSGGISASSLAFVGTNTSGNSVVLQAFITFDPAGNLWVSDAANNRVLRFNAKSLGADAASNPLADIVIGQADFATATYTAGTSPALSLTSFATPSGIAFDSAGRLFVAESVANQRGRILMWTPPFSSGQPASRLLGVDTSTPPPANISDSQFAISPGGLFPIGDSIAAVDTYNSRILVFAPVEKWLFNTTWQSATTVIGQADFASGSRNRGQSPAADRLAFPTAAVLYNSELYVADTFNNRVIVMPQSSGLFGPATRVLGQDQMNQNAPNLVEGREFNFGSSSFDGGLAVDGSTDTPHLYVADTYNNRILGFKDLRNLVTGGKADIVIGQPDFQQTVVNYPQNNATQTNASGLSAPTGLAVDYQGNLFVADTGNGRVLRFPRPFENYVPGTAEQADLVLGQSAFSATRISDATSRTMAAPYGLAYTSEGDLLVSDVALNRVLFFQGPSANFQSGMAASIVFGQPDFNSSAPGSGNAQMQAPHHIATDLHDRLYVADTGNSRVEIFANATSSASGPAFAQVLTRGLHTPLAVYVSPVYDDIWVADGAVGAIHYPQFDQLVVGQTADGGLIDANLPFALVEDSWGNMFLADAGQRVGIYYPELAPINAANFLNPSVLAPGMIAALYSLGGFNQFGGAAQNATALPLPTQMNGFQVLFNGSAVPLFYADSNQVNFQVPNSAPQSGLASLIVKEIDTGRIIGDTTVVMTPSLPGIFTQAGNGSGAAAAINQDGTINSQTSPAVQGSIITLFGTGQGFLPTAPADGSVANAQVLTPSTPILIMGTAPVPPANIKYSGLAPTLVGVWQINVQIPDTVITLPNNPTQVVLIQNNVASGGGGLGRTVGIYVKQR
jgi:uncharacterized protein (TIGR03437 family)